MEESSEKGGLGNGTIFALAFWLVTWTLLPRMSGYVPRRKKNKIYVILIAISILIIAANQKPSLRV